MAITAPRRTSALSDDELLERAFECGFKLAEYELDTGQLVFEWRRGHGPGPLFVTRRVALHWMVDWFRRALEIASPVCEQRDRRPSLSGEADEG